MKKIIIIVIAFILATNICSADEITQTGRLKIDSKIPDIDCYNLPDLTVKLKDMSNFDTTDLLTVLPNNTGHISVNNQGRFLYTNPTTDSIALLFDINIGSLLPESETNLTFMNSTEAGDTVKNIVENLFGIQTEVYHIYALNRMDYENALSQFMEELNTDTMFIDKKTVPQFTEWETDDVCYIIWLFQTEQGVPFFARGETAVAAMDVVPYCANRTSITAMLFEDGIQYLKIENMWDITSQTVNKAVIPATEAIRYYTECVNDLLATGMVYCCDVRLVYCVKDEFAKPFWSFEKEKETDTFTYVCHDLIDARNGQLVGDGE